MAARMEDSQLIVDSWSKESVVGQSPAGKNVSTDAEDILESVIRQRLVKTQ
jgi:hypothetical protein